MCLLKALQEKTRWSYEVKTENNRTVNFVAPHSVIGQFVDIKITDVVANSLRGDLVRQEKDMGLRIAHSPADILANNHHTSTPSNLDELGVGTFTP